MGDQLHIGSITSVNPGKRSLRIEVPRSWRQAVKSMTILECVNRQGQAVRCRVASSKESTEGVIATVVPGVPRDTIAQLKKHAIAVPNDLALRDSKRFDAEELSGLNLADASGAIVGRVAGGFKTSANGMIEVELHGGGAMILPVTSEVVASVDWVHDQVLLMPEVPIDGGMDEDMNEESGAQA